MLCERCQKFDIQAFGRDSYPYRGVPLVSVIQSSNHCSFCSLLLESLRSLPRYINNSPSRFGYLFPLHSDEWVNFTATKATKQPVAGCHGLNVASIGAFVGSINVRDPEREGYVKFHVAADPGKMFSCQSHIPVLTALSLSRHPSFNVT